MIILCGMQRMEATGSDLNGVHKSPPGGVCSDSDMRGRHIAPDDVHTTVPCTRLPQHLLHLSERLLPPKRLLP